RLFANNSYTKLATSSPFSVVAPTLTGSPSPVTRGSVLTATWSGISGPTSQDWIAVFASSGTADTGTRVAWHFTNGAASGSMPITIPASATPGATYELRLFSNNGFTKLATSSSFTVQNAAPVGVSDASHAVLGNVQINVPASSGLLVGVIDPDNNGL